MKAKEFREKTVDELKKTLIDLFRKQFQLRMQKGMSELSTLDMFKKVRRDIARVKTILREKV